MIDPVEVCGAVRYCGRWLDHRGPHGGFRKLGTSASGSRQLRVRGTRLTPMEHRIARRFALGWTWTTICADLAISRATLSKHTLHAKDKYGVTSMPELFSALGWMTVPDE